jgi:hypothetical protein
VRKTRKRKIRKTMKGNEIRSERCKHRKRKAGRKIKTRE